MNKKMSEPRLVHVPQNCSLLSIQLDGLVLELAKPSCFILIEKQNLILGSLIRNDFSRFQYSLTRRTHYF